MAMPPEEVGPGVTIHVQSDERPDRSSERPILAEERTLPSQAFPGGLRASSRVSVTSFSGATPQYGFPIENSGSATSLASRMSVLATGYSPRQRQGSRLSTTRAHPMDVLGDSEPSYPSQRRSVVRASGRSPREIRESGRGPYDLRESGRGANRSSATMGRSNSMMSDVMFPGSSQQRNSRVGLGVRKNSSVVDRVQDFMSQASFFSEKAERMDSLHLFTDFIGEPPDSLKLKEAEQAKSALMEARELTEFEVEDGIGSWSKPERIEGFTDFADNRVSPSRNLVEEIGFGGRGGKCWMFLYAVSVAANLGGLSAYLATGQREFDRVCWDYTCQNRELSLDPTRGNELCRNNGNVTECTDDFCCRAEGDTPVWEEIGWTPNKFRDYQGVLSSMVTSLVGIVFSLIAFSFLRNYMTNIFNSKEELEEAALKQGRRVSFQIHYNKFQARRLDAEADLVIGKAGLDGYMLLRFHTMCCRLCTTLGWLLMMVLCPLHVLFGSNKAAGPLSVFGLDSIDANDRQQGALFWVHTVFIWVVVYVVGAELISTQENNFLVYRYGWLSALPRPRATTVLVENIPREYRSDKALFDFFSSVFPMDSIDSTYVVRVLNSDLGVKYKDVKLAKKRLEIAEGKAKRDGVRPKVKDLKGLDVNWRDITRRDEDALDLFSEEVAESEEKFLQAQMDAKDLVEQQGGVDLAVFGREGFVTFTSRKWQALALDRRYRADARDLVCSLPPDPQDIIFSDFTQNIAAIRARVVGGYALFVLLLMVGTPIFSMIVACMTPEFLISTDINFLVDLGRFIEANDNLNALLQGVGQPLAFKCLMNCVPMGLYIIIHHCTVLKAGTQEQARLQEMFFIFQVIFVVFSPIFGRWLVIHAYSFIQDPAALFGKLEESVPQSTNFILNLVVTSWLSVCAFLCRPIVLLRYTLSRAMFDPHDAAVRNQNEHPAFFGTGVRMSKATIMMTLMIIFCLMCPLICFAVLVYFMIGRNVWRYLLLKAEQKRADTGGAYWVHSLNQLWASLFMSIVVNGVILWMRSNKASGHPWPGVVSLLSVVIFFRMYSHFSGLEWETLPLEKVVELDRAYFTVQGEEYIQPELAKFKTDSGAESQHLQTLE